MVTVNVNQTATHSSQTAYYSLLSHDLPLCLILPSGQRHSLSCLLPIAVVGTGILVQLTSNWQIWSFYFYSASLSSHWTCKEKQKRKGCDKKQTVRPSATSLCPHGHQVQLIDGMNVFEHCFQTFLSIHTHRIAHVPSPRPAMSSRYVVCIWVKAV